MKIQHYEVGVTKIKQFSNMGDGFLLDWDNFSGFVFYAFINNPTEKEIAGIANSGSFEIAFTENLRVGFVCVKFEGMFWGDCTFETRLYDEKPKFPLLTADKGLGFHVVLVDPSKEGVVLGLRAIRLGHEFSEKLIAWYEEKSKYPFQKENYLKSVERTQNQYSSTQLAKKALFTWKTSESGGSGKTRNAINREDGR